LSFTGAMVTLKCIQPGPHIPLGGNERWFARGCVCFPQRLLHSQSKPFLLLGCPAVLLALFLPLRHSFRWLSFSISQDTMGGHQCPKGDTFCSSPHRLRLLVHRTERGEGSRQHILSLSQGLLFPFPSHTPQWRLFQDVPNLFCEHPVGFVEKKPPKEFGLPLCPNTRALHGPAREHLASSNSPSI